MTDDEAFVRAVVDAPGDDTPRLVYADWLDDHDQPERAAYLRAERAAVVSGDAAGLRGLAAGLDPVWVARVSRPPYGLCLDRVRFGGQRTRPSEADINSAEKRLNAAANEHRGLHVRFPDDYRRFLTIHNGGPPSPAKLTVRGPENELLTVEITKFYSLHTTGDLLKDFVWGNPWGFVGRYLPIANADPEHGVVFLGLSEHDFGRVLMSPDVVQHDWRWQPMIEVAPDLPGLLALLHN